MYIGDKKILPFLTPLRIGKITIKTTTASKEYEIEKVEFYTDNTLRSTDITEPYSWTWNTLTFFRHTVKVIAYDTAGHNSTREFTMWKLF